MVVAFVVGPGVAVSEVPVVRVQPAALEFESRPCVVLPDPPSSAVHGEQLAIHGVADSTLEGAEWASPRIVEGC